MLISLGDTEQTIDELIHKLEGEKPDVQGEEMRSDENRIGHTIGAGFY